MIGLDVIFPPAAGSVSEDDLQFRNAIRDSANVVLAGKVKSEETRFTLRQTSPTYGNRFIDTTARFGIVNLPLDIDDVRRRYMPFIYDEDQGERLPTFSMAVLNSYYNQPAKLTAELQEDAFQYVQKTIPLYDGTSFLINYYGADSTFTRVDIVDVLDDSTLATVDEATYGTEINSFDNPSYGVLHDSIFADKIVLVGSTDPEDKDLFLATPSKRRIEDRMMYGVEIHANVIQSIIDGNFIRRQSVLLTFFTVFGLCLFTYVLTAGLKSIRTEYSALIEVLGVALILSELFIIYWASIQLFQRENYLTDMTSPALAVILSYVSSTVYSYVAERRQKILIKGMFSQYVNPTIVDELVAHPDRLRLGGEKKEVTVFFSDIENFTQISEKIQPENLVTILNDYLSEMTAIVIANNGTLDKYEGDAIVAFWGAPLPQEDHALRACRAAVQMQRKLDEVRPQWEREGKPLLQIRIGMSTGMVVVGNM
ncbi:MAG: adenylate/guanylate cyclase domain-containing protein, partial [Candidatus Dadabacteria bacterium]|nr:adenylate/guanylate cyclase domain-containing protein [Candidatus Dadabacteria bacterium]